MRYLIVFLLAAAVPAQTADANQPILEKLLAEVQQFRFAMERSMLLGARTQLAISQLQVQESRLAKVSSEYNEARSFSAHSATECSTWRLRADVKA